MVAGGVEEDSILIPSSTLDSGRLLLRTQNFQLPVDQGQCVFGNQSSEFHILGPDNVFDLKSNS